MRVPRTTRRSNQSILKEINPEESLEGLMLKLQYFGHLRRRDDSLEKTLMLEKGEGNRNAGARLGQSEALNADFESGAERVEDHSDTNGKIGQQGDQASQSERKSTLNIIGRTDAEAPILWPTDAKSQLIGKDPDAGKD